MNLDECMERYRAACKEVSDICTGDRRWTMSIPAQVYSDSDIVISVSLKDIPALVTMVGELESTLRYLVEALEQYEDADWPAGHEIAVTLEAAQLVLAKYDT